MSASIGQPPGIVAAILILAFVAQALKETGIPSPGLTQSLLLYAGYQFSCGSLLFGLGIVVLTLVGSLSGACLVFCLAKNSGNKLLAIISRYTVVTPEAIDKARNKIVANSFLTVAIGRSIPGLMVPTSIVAGTLKMPIRKFLTGIIFPLSLWIILLTTLGGSFGHYMPQLRFNAGSFLILLGALVMLAILASAIYRKKAPSVLESDRTQTISIGQATKDE